MKKAAEKSAVRLSCVVLAVLFFFFAASAASIRHMQYVFGYSANDRSAREVMVNKLYDGILHNAKYLNGLDLAQEFRAYFLTSDKQRLVCPQQLLPENTNFRFAALDAAKNLIMTNIIPKEKVMYSKLQTIDVDVPSADGTRLTETVTVICQISASMQVDDAFLRAFTLAQIGLNTMDYLWSFMVIMAALALWFCLCALRGSLREAKRQKGAVRMFNALPPDLYVCCVLPAMVYFCKMLFGGGITEQDVLQEYLIKGSGEYRFFLIPVYMTGLFAILLILLMLLTFSMRRGGMRYLFSIRRFIQAPFPRRSVVYLLLMQIVKTLSIVIYMTDNQNRIVLFLLLEKLITLPVVYRMLRQLRALMDRTEQFVQGDLSGTASQEKDFATLRAHGADVDSIVRRISDSANEYVQSSQFKAELITNLSHDIKTPLTSIISYAQLLERDDLSDEERVKYLQVLQRHSARLQKLVEDLTEVSDAASGNVPVQLTLVDLCAEVQNAALGFEERLQKQDISIRFCMPDEPVFVTADPRLLVRVTDNLMNNICKYTRSGTEVQIAVVERSSGIAVVFRNHAARPLTMSGEALMERFVREDNSRHTDGSGLGLSIARSLMQLQGGKLWLHTEGDVFISQILFRNA